MSLFTTLRRPLCVAALLALASCAHAPWPDGGAMRLLPADALLLGEQHDAPEHQQWQAYMVRTLATRDKLAALVIEMAEQGNSTEGLPEQVSEERVRYALHWREGAWPWERYGPVVMAAVRMGVPVLGGNLPRRQMQAALQDTAWDAHLPPEALERQRQALREGHCGLLPEPQIAPMTRIQIARDAAMAHTVQSALRPGQTVLLVAGSGHVLRSLGVPTHLPQTLNYKVAVGQAGQAQDAIENEADWVYASPALAPHDRCAELRDYWGQPAPSPQAPQ